MTMRSDGRRVCRCLEDVVRFMKSNNVNKIVIMTGAGISTASGIPDFRTPGTGLYDNLKDYKLPNPEAIFDLDYFKYDPRPFFKLCKHLLPGNYLPNVIHKFIKLISDKGMLLRMYTQNIDGLERKAGIPPVKLVEAHGTFSKATCRKCANRVDGETIKSDIMDSNLPRCTRKGCKVEPFADIVKSTAYSVPRVLFNRTPVGPFRNGGSRPNDVTVAGDIMKSIKRFAELLGWSGELLGRDSRMSPQASLRIVSSEGTASKEVANNTSTADILASDADIICNSNVLILPINRSVTQLSSTEGEPTDTRFESSLTERRSRVGQDLVQTRAMTSLLGTREPRLFDRTDSLAKPKTDFSLNVPKDKKLSPSKLGGVKSEERRLKIERRLRSKKTKANTAHSTVSPMKPDCKDIGPPGNSESNTEDAAPTNDELEKDSVEIVCGNLPAVVENDIQNYDTTTVDIEDDTDDSPLEGEGYSSRKTNFSSCSEQSSVKIPPIKLSRQTSVKSVKSSNEAVGIAIGVQRSRRFPEILPNSKLYRKPVDSRSSLMNLSVTREVIERQISPWDAIGVSKPFSASYMPNSVVRKPQVEPEDYNISMSVELGIQSKLNLILSKEKFQERVRTFSIDKSVCLSTRSNQISDFLRSGNRLPNASQRKALGILSHNSEITAQRHNGPSTHVPNYSITPRSVNFQYTQKKRLEEEFQISACPSLNSSTQDFYRRENMEFIPQLSYRLPKMLSKRS